MHNNSVKLTNLVQFITAEQEFRNFTFFYDKNEKLQFLKILKFSLEKFKNSTRVIIAAHITKKFK